MQIKPEKRKNKYWKVTDDVIDKILARIKNGSTRKHAAEANFVSERHFYSILAQGTVDIEVGIFDSQASRLAQSLREIEANEIEWCRNSTKSSEKGHRGAEWTLEHAYWKYFGNDAPAKELAKEIQEIKELMKKGNLKNDKVDDGEEEEDS